MNNITRAIELWKQLGNIPIDEDECIEENFLNFEIGTHREYIWHWFESEFNLSVVDDLMFNKEIIK